MVKKTFLVDLDIKQSSTNPDIVVVEGDNGNQIVVTLTDNGVAVDLTDCLVLAVFALPNGQTVQQDNDGHGITMDATDDNVFTIELYTTSFTPGLVGCEIQVLSGTAQDVLVTSAQFNFECRRSIMNVDTVLATDEYPILVGLIERTEAVETGLATIDANESTRQLNESLRISQETARDDAEDDRYTAEGLRVTAEQGRVTAESGRVTADSGRTTAESARVSAESGRASAEGTRVSNETARGSAETARASAETTRGTNETARGSAETARGSAESGREDAEDDREAAEGLRDTAETARASAETSRGSAETARAGAESSRTTAESGRVSHDTAFRVWENYDNGKAYAPLNKVQYGGSSYICIANTTGNAPPNTTYWLLIAARGNDGDMIASVYDPTGKNTDAFSVGNMAETTNAKIMTAAERAKLAGIAESANNYTHPANHSPSIITQDSSNRFVTDTEKTTWSSKQDALGFTPINATAKGAANGVAELDSGGKVPTSQLPSYVDDVLEYAAQGNFPITGETDKIYIAQDTNKTYRWSGSAYVEISASLALGETSATAYRGDRGKAAYDHSQATGNPHGMVLGDIGAGDMPKSVYDTNDDGVVDNASKIDGYGVNQQTTTLSNVSITSSTQTLGATATHASKLYYCTISVGENNYSRLGHSDTDGIVYLVFPEADLLLNIHGSTATSTMSLGFVPYTIVSLIEKDIGIIPSAYTEARGLVDYDEYGNRAGEVFNGINGNSNHAAGLNSHARGGNTTASGECSSASGWLTTASAFASTATGRSTVASAPNSTIVGQYGETDTGDVFAVANGSSGTPSIAFRVKADGSVYVNGDLNVSGEIVGGSSSPGTSVSTLPIVLLTESWIGDVAPYVQEILVDGMPESILCIEKIYMGVPTVQVSAWFAGKVLKTGQSEGAVTFSAFGDKPTVDIAVQLIFFE